MSENDILSMESAEAELPEVAPQTDGDLDWRSGLSDDLRNHGDIQSADSLDSLLNRYVDQRKAISNMVKIPGHEAGAEELNKFYERLETIDGVARIPKMDDKEGREDLYRKLGKPESADGYQIEDKELANTLHKLNLNGGQAEAVARMIGESKQDVKQKLETEISEGLELLRSEWGEGFEHRAKAASIALRELGGESIFDMLKSSGYGNHPEMIKLGYNLSQKLGEGKLNIGRTTAKYGTSKEEAAEAIESIMNNPNDPYHISDHPDHDARVETVAKYFEIKTAA